MNGRVVTFGLSVLVAAIVTGTLADWPAASIRTSMGEYQVLSADLHVHTFPFTWSTLSPWDTVVEARWRGLDAVVLTPHNHVWTAKLGQWLSRATGGPIVIVGEEIAARRYHMIAVGIDRTVSSHLTAAEAIDEIHRQGGIAIAAHPYGNTWPAWDAAALQRLDASEIVRPEARHVDRMAAQLQTFFARGRFTAIGSSDYHGLGPIGYCRTYVFARTATEDGVMEALRAGRTVAYDRDRAYGDPDLVRLAAEHGGLPRGVPELPLRGATALFSRFGGLIALGALLLFNRWSAGGSARP